LQFVECERLFQLFTTSWAKAGLFDESGNIGADNKEFLQAWMNHYLA